MEKRKNRESRSIFWPVLLIGAGVIWLLANMGIISSASIAAVFQMWPLLLIFIGLDLLIGHDRPQLRPLLGLLTVAVFVLIALFGPALGLGADAEIQTFNLTAPQNEAESASLRINGASTSISVAGRANMTDILDATIHDTGDVGLLVDGGSARSITLERQSTGLSFGFLSFGASPRFWDIDLTTGLPLSLAFDLASGSADLDLSDVEVTDLRIDGGSGSMNLRLPSSALPYAFRSTQRSGAWNVSLPSGVDLIWTLEDVGSGSLSVSVPDNLGVQLEVQDKGSGSVNVPGAWTQTSGDKDSGVWESAGYGSKDYHTTLRIQSRGSGSISIGF